MATSPSRDGLEQNKKAPKQVLQGRDNRDTNGWFAPALGEFDDNDWVQAHSLRGGNRDRQQH